MFIRKKDIVVFWRSWISVRLCGLGFWSGRYWVGIRWVRDLFGEVFVKDKGGSSR